MAQEADVVFSNNGVIVGTISHTAGTNAIFLGTTGNYEVTFSLSITEPGQFALFLNGTLVPGTIIGGNFGDEQITGSMIISAVAGDALTVRNHTSKDDFPQVNLTTLTGGTQINSNALIKIMLLGN